MVFRRSLFVSVCLLGLCHTIHADGLYHVWSHRFGDVDSQYGSGAAVDASGNVVVTGDFWGTVDFGGGPLTGGAVYSNGFVARFDAAGNHLWSQGFGNVGFPLGCVVVDASGNVVVTGNFWGTVDFGGGPLTSAGSGDIFMAKFDASGTHLWSQRFGDADCQRGESVAVDASGNVVVTGEFDGTVDFGGGPLTSAGGGCYDGGGDIFVAKFDAAGNHLWSQGFGDVDPQCAYSAAIDASGNVVVTGWWVDDGTFVTKFNPSGTYLWSKDTGYPGEGGAAAYSVAVDASGNVVVTGDFWGTVDFGGGPLPDAGEGDIFVAKFDASGTHLWSQRFGDASYQAAYSVAIDASGNVVVTGYFWGTVDFGGGPLTGGVYPNGFVAKFDAAGNHLWSQGFGDDFGCEEYGASVAVDASGNVVVTGEFGGTVDFGGGPLTSPGSSCDIFVVKFAENATGISSTPVGNTLRLHPYPNPFNPEMGITYFVPNSALVDLRIYDVEGRLIQTLVSEVVSFGEHRATWDGRDSRGAAVSSGLYFVRLESSGEVQTRKAVLLK